MQATTAFKKIGTLDHRNKCIQGSQGASKTYSILMLWILKALNSKESELCTVVTDTFPNLRSGAIKDFQKICDDNEIEYYSTKSPYIFKINNWTFEFFSVDKETKGLGGRRDRLFINEANRVAWKTARQLIARTHKERVFDYNPINRFWAHEQFVETKDCDFVKLTYKDNEMLPKAEIESIEKHAPWGLLPDENYWRVFGLGEVGFVEGQIFKGYKTYKEKPTAYDYAAFGMDFGWEDPLVMVKGYVDKKNQRLYLKEMFYASNTRYTDFAPIVKNNPEFENAPVICDHEPRDILELRKMGFSTMEANKANGIVAGIRTMKQYDIYVHEKSKNLMKELDEYKYQYNAKIDSFLEMPAQNQADHAIDAARYVTTFLNNR